MGRVTVRFYDVEFLDEEHVTQHGISTAEILQALRNDPTVRRNRKGRAARYIAFGVTDGNREVVIPLIYDADSQTVYPIAAWEAPR